MIFSHFLKDKLFLKPNKNCDKNKIDQKWKKKIKSFAMKSVKKR